MSERNGNKKKRKGDVKQSKLFGTTVKRLALTDKYQGKKILLKDDIYVSGAPDELKDHLFVYSIIEVDGKTMRYKARYEDTVIKSDGDRWKSWQESEYPSTMNDLSHKQVEEGIELYNTYVGRVNKRINDEKDITRKVLATEERDKTNDFSDIDSIVDKSPKGPKAVEVIMIDFEQTGLTGATKAGNPKQQWKHKLTGKTFWRHQTYNKKGWDTGVFTSELKQIKPEDDKKAHARASYILGMRQSKHLQDPGKSLQVYSFEEDLPYQLNAILANVSTGSPGTWFLNPFVRDYLQSLDPKHRVPYQLKQLRLIRVANDCIMREISLILSELYLKYTSSFVSSNSDFWWDPVRKTSFGAIVANFMAKQYHLNNGLCLFVSETTLKRTDDKAVFRNLDGKTSRCGALLDFLNFSASHTGENIGNWLHISHERHGCKPDYIGSHVVDGAANAGKAVGLMELMTRESRSSKLAADKCTAHQTNRAAIKASGTGGYATNHNPSLGGALTKLHEAIVRVQGSGVRNNVYLQVAKDRGRKPILNLKWAGKTRWNSSYDETVRINQVAFDFRTSLDRMISVGGVDERLYLDTDDIGTIKPTDEDYMIYRQYEGGMRAGYDYSKFTQTSKVSFHLELFEARVCIELMMKPFFEMHEDLSRKTGMKESEDLRKRRMNCIVKREGFNFVNDNFETNYEHSIEMKQEIVDCRSIFVQDLGVRLKLFSSIQLSDNDSADKDSDDPMASLIPTPRITDNMILGAIFNPLMGHKSRMTKSGLCTDEQYRSGEEVLLTRLVSLIEGKEQVAFSDVKNKTKGNRDDESTDSDKDEYDDVVDAGPSISYQQAKQEYSTYLTFMKGKYLPKKVTGTKHLGTLDDEGQPRPPIISVGHVVERGQDLPSSRNLADFIDKTGYFDIVSYLEEHMSWFPNMAKLGIGTLAPHMTAEVDCERLFNTAGYLSDPRRSNMKIRNYERLVMMTHNMHRIFIDKKWVIDKYIERSKKRDWDEKDERDDLQFIELEKELYEERFGKAVCDDEDSVDEPSWL